MSNNVESVTGLSATPALRDAIKEEAFENSKINPDDTPVTSEPPLRKKTGLVDIKILGSKATSEILFKKLNIKAGKILQQGGGHDHIVWDRHYADQIREAREKFYALLDQGYTAHLMKEDGQPCNRQMTKFDPNAEEIIMVAPTTQG